MPFPQEFFYITASVTLILLGLTLTGFLILLVQISLFVSHSKKRIGLLADEAGGGIKEAAKAWSRLNIIKFFVRIYKIIF